MSPGPEIRFLEIVERVKQLSSLIGDFDPADRSTAKGALKPKARSNGIRELKILVEQATFLIRDLSPATAERIQITLGRSDSIAKFFAFSFVFQPKREFSELESEPFLGSGIYAIYYHGEGEPAYSPISGAETPIYIGKADPKVPYAEGTEDQGPSLHLRLKEHARSLAIGDLKLADFRYRYATIQSGMQAAVEEFLIRLFKPIWNKEIKLCFGIGKHGDSSETRANKRSPWDTMHPGRKWALTTREDQLLREEITSKIRAHFEANPPFNSIEKLQAALVGG